jgi:hypothetical protein
MKSTIGYLTACFYPLYPRTDPRPAVYGIRSPIALPISRQPVFPLSGIRRRKSVMEKGSPGWTLCLFATHRARN